MERNNIEKRTEIDLDLVSYQADKSIAKLNQVRNILLRMKSNLEPEAFEKELGITTKSLCEHISLLLWEINMGDSEEGIVSDKIHLDGISIEGNKEEGFRIITPMPAKSRNRNAPINRIIGRALYNEIKNYCEYRDIDTPAYEKAEIKITACIGEDLRERGIAPDPDNLDTKGIIDAMCMKLFYDDNCFSTRIIHEGRKVDSETSYLEINVVELK